MDPTFQSLLDTLPKALERLLSMPPQKAASVPPSAPSQGVYLLSEGRKHLYVGRSNRLRQRVRNHGRPSATANQAAFAFRLAREATGKSKASYKPKGSRAELLKDPAFAEAFSRAKARIQKMDVRYLAETAPLRQYLLELHVAVALHTPYNDFDTH
jgi:hypothetical protein